MALSTDDLLLGIGLAVVLAVGPQLFAKLLRLPAIVPRAGDQLELPRDVRLWSEKLRRRATEAS